MRGRGAEGVVGKVGVRLPPANAIPFISTRKTYAPHFAKYNN